MEEIVSTQNRPVYLDLTKMKFPPTAIVSILHRISGVLIFLLLPFAFYLLHHSLLSEDSFQMLTQQLSMPIMSFLLWVFLSALCLHLFAGIRHLLMDCGFGEGLCTARFTAYLVMVLALIALIIAGVWIWG